MDPIRVLVVDDEETVVDVLRSLIGSDPSLELVGEAHDAEGGIALAARARPDVVLMDVRMPGGGGVRAVREITRRHPDAHVVALSAHEDEDTKIRMIGAGAREYVPKTESTDMILDAIHRAIGRDQRRRPRRPTLRSLDDRREEQRTRVERALAGGAVTAAFQPIVDLATGGLVGVEAQPHVAMLPNRSFDAWIGDAEATGLLPRLEAATLKAALEPLASLPEEVFLEVEVSPATAASARFQRTIRDAWASRIVLTISELSGPPARLATALEPLRNRGVRVCLADIGAGLVGLDHATALWPDFVRLDRTISDEVDRDDVRHAIAAASVGWATKAGSRVIAEAVSTKEQLEELWRVGIELAQGDLLCPPRHVADIASRGVDAFSFGASEEAAGDPAGDTAEGRS